MKILQVIPFFSPKFGGSVSSTFLTCQKLAERGHQVTVLTTDFHFDIFYAQQLKNVEVIPIKCSFNLGLFLFSPKMKVWLSEHLSKFDIIHMQNYRSYQNVLISNFAQKLKVPYILQARGSFLPFFEKQFQKKCFDAIWGHKILKNAACYIALTETESDQYIKMGVPKNKVAIIPNGIDISQYADLPPHGQFRLKYKIPENERMILSLGRIHKIKGIDLLVVAFSQLCCQMNNVKLVIAGPDRGFLSQIQQQIRELQLENKVLFTGPLYGKDKLEAYLDADVFVLPSRYDAFPNTVLEAWACGTPVIVTKGCLISDIVEKAGYVVDANPGELSATLLNVFRSTGGEVRTFIDNGYHLIETEFNLINSINQMEKLYKEIISR
jgi:glycosyltransferase involved in cell wall biosynthesis